MVRRGRHVLASWMWLAGAVWGALTDRPRAVDRRRRREADREARHQTNARYRSHRD